MSAREMAEILVSQSFEGYGKSGRFIVKCNSNVIFPSLQDLASWFLSFYASRQSVPPPVARCWTFLLFESITEEKLTAAIKGSEPLLADPLARARIVLPGWDNQVGLPTFGMDSPWWTEPLREYREDNTFHRPDLAFHRARRFFDVSQFLNNSLTTV
jgi:hypothetical protein